MFIFYLIFFYIYKNNTCFFNIRTQIARLTLTHTNKVWHMLSFTIALKRQVALCQTDSLFQYTQIQKANYRNKQITSVKVIVTLN
ncbi:hypothetical protein [Choristoneura rosaceana nucleopolyhedrovirus]|uniref:Uncharacterized protein n=1 Tax=Choristoneura rosaceana nucleopolyhedrovirus TaxID=58094 RepID=S5MR62_9ABAC|nr:hypothetical protein [Choristoneura rosaceana nucleopolyhedrovirus]AGR57044.1 hypothetical protein [Choristoneura rosaceana nucleopolyhedrovirus]